MEVWVLHGNGLALAKLPMATSVDEEALHQLYLWVDNIPLSRPKRNLSRDFSDGGACPRVRVRTHMVAQCFCASGCVLGVESVYWDLDLHLFVNSMSLPTRPILCAGGGVCVCNPNPRALGLCVCVWGASL